MLKARLIVHFGEEARQAGEEPELVAVVEGRRVQVAGDASQAHRRGEGLGARLAEVGGAGRGFERCEAARQVQEELRRLVVQLPGEASALVSPPPRRRDHRLLHRHISGITGVGLREITDASRAV